MKTELEKEKTKLLERQCEVIKRLAEIQAELDKTVILEPQGGKFYVSIGGTVYGGIGTNFQTERYAAYCQTMEQAKELARLSYAQNRIYNFAIQHDGYRPFVAEQKNWYVYYDSDIEKYSRTFAKYTHEPEKVYMTQECTDLFIKQTTAGLIKMEWEG